MKKNKSMYERLNKFIKQQKENIEIQVDFTSKRFLIVAHSFKYKKLSKKITEELIKLYPNDFNLNNSYWDYGRGLKNAENRVKELLMGVNDSWVDIINNHLTQNYKELSADYSAIMAIVLNVGSNMQSKHKIFIKHKNKI